MKRRGAERVRRPGRRAKLPRLRSDHDEEWELLQVYELWEHEWVQLKLSARPARALFEHRVQTPTTVTQRNREERNRKKVSTRPHKLLSLPRNR